ncbi:MAG: hypothetical protein V7K89_00320 [Nostoc sp.]|uniref:hypothetical protein n=1 Tax=Nostoc sp. TaxID=1180 RepID=UPI002FFA5121
MGHCILLKLDVAELEFTPGGTGASLFYVATGAITLIQNKDAERVVTGLPSLALLNGTDTIGVSDIEFDADGNAYAIIGLASDPANRDTLCSKCLMLVS